MPRLSPCSRSATYARGFEATEVLYYVCSTLQSNLENLTVGLLAQMAAQARHGAAACVEERAEPKELQGHFALFFE